MLKMLKEKLSAYSSAKRVFIESVVTLVLLGFFKSIFIYSIFITYLIVKLIVGIKIVKSNKLIDIKGRHLKLSYDLLARNELFAEIQLLLLVFLGCVLKNTTISDVYLETSFLMYFIFVLSICLLYRIKCVALKILPTIIATPLGFIITMVGVVWIMSRIEAFFVLINDFLKLNIDISSTNFDFSPMLESLLTFASYIEFDMSFLVYSTCLCVFLNAIYVYSTPIYHLNVLKRTFSVLNTFFSCFTLIIVVISVMSYPKLQNIVQSNMDILSSDEHILDYYTNFSVDNIQNIFKLSILPYSISLILCNCFIKQRNRRATLKKENSIKILLSTKDEEVINSESIKFLQNGGKPLELEILDKIKK